MFRSQLAAPRPQPPEAPSEGPDAWTQRDFERLLEVSVLHEPRRLAQRCLGAERRIRGTPHGVKLVRQLARIQKTLLPLRDQLPHILTFAELVLVAMRSRRAFARSRSSVAWALDLASRRSSIAKWPAIDSGLYALWMTFTAVLTLPVIRSTLSVRGRALRFGPP